MCNCTTQEPTYLPKGILHAVLHGSEQSKSSALGKDAKYVVGTERAEAQERRKQAYQMQRRAAWLLPDQRVSNCRWAVQRRDTPVELIRHADGHASYAGLQTCGSVWACPVCSRRISEQRRAEMNQVLHWSRGEKHTAKMLTLTCQHQAGDDLSEQLTGMKSALRKLRTRQSWRKIKEDAIVGNITATEVTHGRNGWHTHFHMILILSGEPASWENRRGEEVDPWDELSAAWIDCLRTEGMSGQLPYAFDLQDANEAGEYVAKWGAAEELALSGQKSARGGGRTPFQLLRDFTFEQDKAAGQRFVEFANAFKGARQLVWSDGLKDLAGVDEIEDEEAAGEDQQGDEDELVAMIDYLSWVGNGDRPGVRRRRIRVLEAAERSVEAGRLIIGIGADDDEPEDTSVIEDPDPPPFLS